MKPVARLFANSLLRTLNSLKYKNNIWVWHVVFCQQICCLDLKILTMYLYDLSQAIKNASNLVFYIKKMHFDLNNKEGRGGLAATKASNRRFKKNSEFNIQEGWRGWLTHATYKRRLKNFQSLNQCPTSASGFWHFN